MTRIAKTVWVAQIAPKFWLHTTTDLIPGGFYYPANGLVVEGSKDTLLIDTGYRPDQAEALLEWSKRTLARPITLAVVTHFHNDRTGGVPALQKQRIRILGHPVTCELCRDHGMPVPDPIENFRAKPYPLTDGCELYFPGPGHTRDNIVVWLPDHETLFGGCMLKSTTSNGLGNLDDAVFDQWAESVRRAHEKYPRAKTVIPGHGAIAGDSVGHTLSLLAKKTSL